ncbi:MAG: BON domain-containing protein [Deltaproteobacteria bacterium]|nr:BON domain-containing protein [Deltaproteobacteria bacterium]
MRLLKITAVGILLTSALTGCWAGAAAVGGEAGYVAAQDSRSAGQTIDDQLIVSKVKSKFLADSEVSGLAINVDSFKGQVTLKGFVKSAHEADKAIEIAQNTSGVRGVTSKLVVD